MGYVSDMERIRSTIVNMVISNDIFNDDCNIYYFEKEDGTKRHQAVSTLRDDVNLHVIFSIPTNTHNIYITVSDGDASLIRQLFATLEDIEGHERIGIGCVQLFDDTRLIENDVRGIILLPIITSNILNFLPTQLEINEVNYNFILVVFLSTKEYQQWKTKGHDALIDYFIENKKDLVAFDLS
ncbi:hypothetical protein IRT38_04995 [Acinetobacter sp. SK-43]|uniref:hypothetical protein n=1 Tax=Acinetobacter sp. SK-43 TaxID=2785295 RepID=UPI00188AB1B1|nr:hypothetical protein [Acinetobacter sp. SK-43]MBF4454756.1 hypothetical protein [Acinetobacter sp. SK-43]